MIDNFEKPKISPEDYKKIIKGIDLISISMKDSKSFINLEIKTPTELNINIKDESSFETKGNNEVFVFNKYSIDARKPNSKSRYIQIDVTFLIKLFSKENFCEDFFDIYKNVSLHLNTWPYMREFVSQMTSRMNIPPLTVPLFKTFG